MMGSVDKVYILSSDYWSFDTATLDSALNFYTNTWILPKTDYKNLKGDDQSAYYRCALFYHTNRRDNHGYMPTVISQTTDGVRVMGRNQQHMLEPRTYQKGDSTGYTVSDGTNTIEMQAATATKGGKVKVDENVAGKFKIENFYTTNQDINQTINMLENESTQEAEEYSAESHSTGGQNMNAEHNKTEIDVDLKEGALTQFGWHADASAKKRKSALLKSVDHDGYEKTMQRLNILHTYWKNNQKGMARKVTNDMDFLRSTFRAEDTSASEDIDSPAPHSPAPAPAGSEMIGGDGGAPLINVDSASAPPEGVFVSSAETFGAEDFSGEEVNPETTATLPHQPSDYPGMPVVANSFGEGSALGAGQGVPEWYGSAESQQTFSGEEVMDIVADAIDGSNLYDSGIYEMSNSYGENSGGYWMGGLSTGGGVPQWYGSAEGEGNTGDSMNAEEFMTLLAEVVEGIVVREAILHEKSNTKGKAMAAVLGIGTILAAAWAIKRTGFDA